MEAPCLVNTPFLPCFNPILLTVTNKEMKPKLHKPGHHNLRGSEKYFPGHLLLREKELRSIWTPYFLPSAAGPVQLFPNPQVNFFWLLVNTDPRTLISSVLNWQLQIQDLVKREWWLFSLFYLSSAATHSPHDSEGNPIASKNISSKNETAQAFFFAVYKPIYYTGVTQVSACVRRRQQIVVCTKIGEKLSQHRGSAEAFTQLRKQASSFFLDLIHGAFTKAKTSVSEDLLRTWKLDGAV